MPFVPSLYRSLALAALMAGAAVGSAQAEKADRNKPLVVESDGKQAASVNLGKRTTVVSGNVVITQGTMQIRADRVEIREESSGQFAALATGSAGKPAIFRQKRDRLDEVIEAEAQRIEVDGGKDRVRFTGEAKMRVLRAGQPADEASATAIVYDQPSDTLTFEGGGPSSSAGAAGRARLVFVPRSGEAASVPAPKAGDGR